MQMVNNAPTFEIKITFKIKKKKRVIIGKVKFLLLDKYLIYYLLPIEENRF